MPFSRLRPDGTRAGVRAGNEARRRHEAAGCTSGGLATLPRRKDPTKKYQLADACIPRNLTRSVSGGKQEPGTLPGDEVGVMLKGQPQTLCSFFGSVAEKAARLGAKRWAH